MKRNGILGAIAPLAAILAFAGPAHARMVTAEPAAILEILKSTEHDGTRAGEDGTHYIEASHNGIKFVVFFMNCQDDGTACTTLQYYMGYSDAKETTLEKLNQWNGSHRFARAYRDDDGDPVLEMDVDLDFAGLPRENVAESFNTWFVLMDEFHQAIFGE